MAYYFYLGTVMLPVTPAKLQMKINNQNKLVTLIDETEINLVKQAKLTDIEFDFLIPQAPYPFAVYIDGFRQASYYTEALKKLKTGRKPFQFIVTRTKPEGAVLFSNNLTVTLESYTLKEDWRNGLDLTASVKLKQFEAYGTGTEFTVSADGTATLERQRETSGSPEPENPGTYTVQKGDTLWHIARRHYGDGSLWQKIHQANPDIADPNRIYPGQEIHLPAGGGL